MARKINSEIVVDNDNFKIKVGTTDKKNPKTVYIDCGFFIEPKTEKEDYSEDVKYIETEARNVAKKVSNATNPNPENIDRLFNKNYVFVFEVAETRVFYGKKSYISFQLHLKQNEECLNFDEISKYVIILSEYMTSVLLHRINEIGFAT